METQTVNILFYGGLAGAATVLGMAMVIRSADWARRNNIYLISFAAGVLLAAAFTVLLPESLELTERGVAAVLLSFLAFYLLEHYILLHTHHHEHGHEGPARPHSLTLIAFVGLAFHSLLDGIVIGTGFEVDFSLGLIATLGVISHEVPEGISIMSVMLYGGYSRVAATLYSLVVALATPLGALFALFGLQGTSSEVLGVLLAMAAGSFVYIAASDLIPEIHHTPSVGAALLVIGGAALILAAGAILG